MADEVRPVLAQAAVAEAAFMTGLEANSEVVQMASYAPLFVNTNARVWSPDMIVFDSHRQAPCLLAASCVFAVLLSFIGIPILGAPSCVHAVVRGCFQAMSSFKAVWTARRNIKSGPKIGPSITCLTPLMVLNQTARAMSGCACHSISCLPGLLVLRCSQVLINLL